MQPNSESNSELPKQTPVMDVQPPASTPPKQETDNQSVQPAPAAENTDNDTAATDTTAAPATVPAEVPVTSTEPGPLMAVTVDNAGAKKKSIVLIILTLVCAAALAGIAAALYMRQQAATSTSNQTSQQDTAAPATNNAESLDTQVESTDKEIDASITEANESTDFSDADMSDASLGL